MKINVILRNTSPIFSATPGSDRIGVNGEINPPMNVPSFPFTRTRKMSIPAMVGDKIVPMAVPVVPGNTMRKLLRLSILNNVILKQLQGRDKLSIGAYAAAFSGNATGRPEGVATFDEIVQNRSHLFLGLFGGGPRMMQGRLTVDSLYPIHRNTVRILGEGLEDRLVSGDITDIVWLRRVDPILATRDESAEELVEGGRKALTQWAIDGLEAAAAKRSKKDKEGEGEGDDPRGLRTFNAHEVVIPGVDWVLQIGLDNPTPAQVGLVLAGIEKMPQQPIAGGFSKGYGQFNILDVTLDGSPIWQGNGYGDNEAIEQYFDALAVEVDALTAKPFESFIAPNKPAKEVAE